MSRFKRKWNAQEGRCCYCSEPMIMRPEGKKGLPNISKGVPHLRAATEEHLKRKADGGTNASDNVALACYECNTGRGSIDWLTYKSLKQGELSYVG